MVLAIAVVFTFMPMVTLTANAASKTPLVTKAVNDNGTTTKYSYNKKGLVKKAVSTSSKSKAYEDESCKATTTYKYNKKNKITTATTTDVDTTTYYKTDNTTGKVRGASEGSVAEKTTSVTKFTYNKKGLATKSEKTSNYTMSGSTSSSNTELIIPNSGRIRKFSDGSYKYYDWEAMEEKSITEAQVAAYAKKYTSTTTYTENADGTYTKTGTYRDGTPITPETHKYQTTTTKSYTYKKKNVKTETASRTVTEEDVYKYADGSSRTETIITTYNPTVTAFKYKKGRVVKATTTNPNTYSRVTVYKTVETDGTVKETKIERANGVVTTTHYVNGAAQGTPQTSTYKEAKPSTSVATYKYDKKGNLKSSKGNYTDNGETQLKDEVYLDEDDDEIGVYFINALGEEEELMTPISTVYSWSKTVTTTVKKGTKRLLTSLGMTKNYKDGYAVDEENYSTNKSAYSMGRIKFTVKAKKVAKKAAKNVESQQWMIQNNVFQVVGL
jgi:YD repeat-containing protein